MGHLLAQERQNILTKVTRGLGGDLVKKELTAVATESKWGGNEKRGREQMAKVRNVQSPGRWTLEKAASPFFVD